jgi:hypothetical protein
MSWKKDRKDGKRSKYPRDEEEEKRFEELRRKYANAIAYLLVTGIA